MKRLLQKLTSDCLFSFNNKLYKQTNGCAMGNPLSVILAGIFMSKLEKEVVYPENPILFKRYVDDVFRRKKVGEVDTLFTKMNNFHKNIKFEVEINLEKFLDTKLERSGNIYNTTVNRNGKLPMHWSSKVPKKFKRNIINNDLHRASRISSDFVKEVDKIRGKYYKADFPKPYVESVIKQFNEKNAAVETNDPTTTVQEKKFIPIEIPFCDKNEKIASHFLKKLNSFTNNNFKFTVIWKTRKMSSLFKLKDKVKIPSCVIYQGTVEEDESIKYIGETKLISVVRWGQHEDINHDSNPARYLKSNPTRKFVWKVLCKSSVNTNKRKIHEALFIAKFKPSLNKHISHKNLTLYKHGIT